MTIDLSTPPILTTLQSFITADSKVNLEVINANLDLRIDLRIDLNDTTISRIGRIRTDGQFEQELDYLAKVCNSCEDNHILLTLSLNISNNIITEKCLESLKDALKDKKYISLKAFSACNTGMSNEVFKDLKNIINNEALSSLDLANNIWLDEGSASSLIKLLENKKMSFVGLSYNDYLLKTFLEGLKGKNNIYIEKLKASDHILTPRVIKALYALLQEDSQTIQTIIDQETIYYDEDAQIIDDEDIWTNKALPSRNLAACRNGLASPKEGSQIIRDDDKTIDDNDKKKTEIPAKVLNRFVYGNKFKIEDIQKQMQMDPQGQKQMQMHPQGQEQMQMHRQGKTGFYYVNPIESALQESSQKSSPVPPINDLG